MLLFEAHSQYTLLIHTPPFSRNSNRSIQLKMKLLFNICTVQTSGRSTSTSVDITTTGSFSFSLGIADDGDSGAGGGGGPFRFSKKKSREDIVRSVVLVFGS